jgi:hypothetical protein
MVCQQSKMFLTADISKLKSDGRNGPTRCEAIDGETWSCQPRPCESNEWCLAVERKENGSSSLKTSDKLSAPKSAEGREGSTMSIKRAALSSPSYGQQQRPLTQLSCKQRSRVKVNNQTVKPQIRLSTTPSRNDPRHRGDNQLKPKSQNYSRCLELLKHLAAQTMEEGPHQDQWQLHHSNHP